MADNDNYVSAVCVVWYVYLDYSTRNIEIIDPG